MNTLANVVMTAAIVGVGVLATIVTAMTRYGSYNSHQEEREALERQKYRAVDFGGMATPAPATAPPTAPRRAAPPATATPLTAQPADSVLARAVADHRSPLARASEWAAVAVGSVLIGVLLVGAVTARYGGFDDRGAPEAVGELLELHGFAAPKVRRQWLAIHCRYNSFAYRWSAMGAEGRACVQRDDGEIKVKIDRSWGKLPAVAFERVEVRPVEAETVGAVTPQELLRPDDLAPSELAAPPSPMPAP